MTDKQQDWWHLFFPAVVFTLNNSINSSTNYAPSMLVVGKQALLPIEAGINLVESLPLANPADVVVALTQRRKEVKEMAHANLKLAQVKMKERYDKRARPHGYSVGQYCFLHIPSLLTPHTSKKMQSRFSGPYIITQFTSPVTCMLVRCRDGKLTKKSVHVHLSLIHI